MGWFLVLRVFEWAERVVRKAYETTFGERPESRRTKEWERDGLSERV